MPSDFLVGLRPATPGQWLGWAGLALLAWRFRPWLRQANESTWPSHAETGFVSVILPCRNEAANIAACVQSLLAAADTTPCEIIVIDDESTDETAAIAAEWVAQDRRIRLIQAGPRPDQSWVGKTWACHRGAQMASGDYLLFTDADTRHAPESLAGALAALQGYDLLSALPRHRSASVWEGLTGPLQLLALAVTAPFDTPRPRRLFAIGQYLLFRRAAYDRLGGHEAVRGALAEDLHLARRALELKLAYGVANQRFYAVRMYERPRDFLAGWRRLSALGIEFGSPMAPIEIILFYCAFAGGGSPMTPAGALLSLATIACALRLQGRLGDYSIWGPLLWPLPLATFALATGLGLLDRLRGRITWRGRNYALGKLSKGGTA